MKIKVLRCSKDTYRYSNRVGEIFDVEPCDETEYFKYKYTLAKDTYTLFDYRDVVELVLNKSTGCGFYKDSNAEHVETFSAVESEDYYNPIVKIKIIKCSNPLIKKDGPRWYKNHIGEIFEVKYFNYCVPMYDVAQYILPDGRTIAMEDAEEVKETKMKVVEKVKEEKQKYPCLRTNAEGTIFLATNSTDGIVLKSKSYYTGCLVTFSAETFLYSGTLEISNGD